MRSTRAEGRIRSVIIPSASPALSMTSMSDALSNSPTRAPWIRRARRAGGSRALKRTMTTKLDSSTPSPHSASGSAIAAMRRRRLALAYTLLEGWEKGYLQLCPAECKWSCLSNSCETTASPEIGID